MVNGVVSIPLPGRTKKPTADQGGLVASRHFLVGPENRLVEVAVRSLLEQSPDGYNSLVLYGPSGTGKSHLAHGLATVWKNRHRRRRVVYTTAVDFARELADAIESQGVEDFRLKHRGADLLVIEDLGMLATRKSGKLNAQEELIHTLDVLSSENRWVVVTASASPAELPGILPTLQSRLMGGLSIPLAIPGPETRLAILHQLTKLHDIQLSDAVVEVLAEKLRGTVPELAGSLLQFEVPARLRGDRLDPEMAKQYLAAQGDLRQPSLHEIALATSRHFSLRLSDLRSSVRRRTLVTARGVAFYLARNLAGANLQQIGDYFGGRDHTTVMHGCRKTKQLMESDPSVGEAVKSLQKALWKS